MVKNLPANAGDTVNTGSILSWEDLLEEEMATHSSILFFFPLQYSCLEKSHRERSLVGYNPWSHKELDATKPLDTKQLDTKSTHKGLLISKKLISYIVCVLCSLISSTRNIGHSHLLSTNM